MGGCSAINCTNHSRKGHRMFRFPADIDRKKRWVINCRRDNWIPGPSAQLCSEHFEDSQYEQNRKDGWKKLKQNAIPTLFKVPNPPNTLNEKRIKGFGLPKPNSFFASHLDPDHQIAAVDDNDNPLHIRVKQLEEENAKLKQEVSKLKEEIKKIDKSLQFLSEEQKKAARIKRASIKSWSQEGIIDALKLRFALGKFGYDYLRGTGYPSPSYSTLYRRMENIKMNFGILNSFLDCLKVKVDLMNPSDRWCSIVIDEMEISKTIDFDTSSKSFVGRVTLGPDTAPGSHYTVVLLRGLKNKWKQVIAHEVTGPSTPGSDMKDLIDRTINTCQELGLTVKAIVSDMGSTNRAMWKDCGVNVSRNARSTAYDSSYGEIHCVADVPHLLKNLRSATLKNPLKLPVDVCEAQGLPTNVVSSGYIKSLWIKEIEAETSLRSLHHLTKDHLFPSHFKSMNVAIAAQFFSVKTASALEKAVRLNEVNADALTTAWWIRLVQEWFELMTARHVKKGVTHKNRHIKLKFLNDFVKIVQSMSFGTGWKPLQTGLILSTLSVINLVNDTLTCGFGYFLPGRLSQDALENVFSQVRRKAGTKPSALKARCTLKLICVSQFISDLKNVNYSPDKDNHLFSISAKELPKNVTSPVLQPHNSGLTSSNKPLTCSDENEVYYIAGVTLNSILNKKLCNTCKQSAQNAIDPNEENIPDYLKFLTKYSDMGGLHYPSSGFYRICREVEREVQHHKDKWMKDQIPILDGTITAVRKKCNNVEMPECCSLKDKIIRYYLMVRCKGIVRHLEQKSAYEVSFSSASVAKKMRKA